MPDMGLDTSVLDLKTAVAKEVRLDGVAKVRVLWAKKPCADSKSVKDIIASAQDALSEGVVEFSVMVIGGVAEDGGKKAEAPPAEGAMEVDSPAPAPVAQGKSGEEMLGSEEFWGDLRGFLVQRVRDEAVAGEVFEIFRGAWGRRGGG